MNHYATLGDLRRYLALSAGQTGDDDLLLELLRAASRLIEGYTGRRFYPRRQTRTYTVRRPDVLLLDDDLLELRALTNGDGQAIPLAAVHAQPSGLVASRLVLDRSRAVFTHSGDPVDALAVEGVWGFHPAWAEAWAASGDSVQDAPLSAAATTLHVADADAPDASGYGQRFMVGQLLRLGDEYLHVLAVDTAANALTVARGVNGTQAAEHAQGTPIDVYSVPADVRSACLRLASWLYRQPDAGFVQVGGGLSGRLVVPPAMPEDVQAILAPYVRVRVA